MVVPNCTDCPSFVKAENVRDRFKRPVGVPMCGTYGYILGKHDLTPKENNELRAIFADGCPSYGEPMPSVPVSVSPRVAPLDDDIISDGPTNQSVPSCFGCRNLVKMNTVMEAWGWPLPLCRAKGTLVFDAVKESKDCAWPLPGTPSESLQGIDLMEQYHPGFAANPDKALQAAVNNGNLNIEPSEYVTDSPVSEDDRADGIRAWRNIEDPYGSGKVIPLPIFDINYFSEAEQELIPQTGDEHHPELYVDYANLLWHFAVDSWMLGETLLLQSDPGLGKTEFCYWLAWLMQVPFRRVAFKGTTEYDEVFGKMVYKPEKGTYWVDGRFSIGYRSHACVLNVDEPNLAANAIVESLRTTTDTDGMLYIDGAVPENEDGTIDEKRLMIPKGSYVFPVWCINPAWDPRNIGAKELANADVDRLSPAVVPYPPAELERHIIRERCKVLDNFEIPEPILNDLMKVAADIREMAKQGEFPGSWGLRQQIKVARKLAWYPFEQAFRMAALNFYEPETVEYVIKTSINTVRA